MQRYELKLKDLYKKLFFLLKLARRPISFGFCMVGVVHFFCSANTFRWRYRRSENIEKWYLEKNKKCVAFCYSK